VAPEGGLLVKANTLCLVVFCLTLSGVAAAADVEITVRDKGGQPMPCRMHVKDAAGKAQRAGELPFWFDHFVAPGQARLQLEPGKYTIEIERGPEFGRIAESFEVKDQANQRLTYEMARTIDLAAEGWWAGELHVHRPMAAMELLMRAEDLHVAPVITWWNKQNAWDKKALPVNPLVQFDNKRSYHVMAGEDEREGGALLYFQLRKPLAIAASGREFPSPMKYVGEARLMNDDVWIDIEKPFWWDVPVWLATGQMNSIGLANNHMCRDRMFESEAWGKPRIVERLPAPVGNGYWTQEIYYHILNTGLRLPPSAGSASGVLPNPVGYNRAYVYLGKEMDVVKWWRNLAAGRSFVTNGPLLRVTANGKLPGEVFAAQNELKLDLKADLATQDPIRFVEVIRNGEVERRVLFQDVMKTGSLGVLEFKESGWFLVRAIADNKKTFRFASTAPFYVEIGANKQRISKAAAAFFLAWARERMGRIQLNDETERREVLSHHLRAEKFWLERVAKANTE
jgi:hypothetical protein